MLFSLLLLLLFCRVSHTAIPQTLKQMHNVCLKFPPDLVQKQIQLIKKYQRSTISTPSANMHPAGLLGHPNATTNSHSGPFVGFKASSNSSNSSSNSAPTPLRADIRVICLVIVISLFIIFDYLFIFFFSSLFYLLIFFFMFNRLLHQKFFQRKL